MANNHSPAPTPAHPGRFVRFVRRLLFFLVCLATLVALFYTVENWRGKRAWLNCKRELEAKGYQLDLDPFLPKPVSDERNIIKASSVTGWVEKVNGTNTDAVRIPETGLLSGDWPNSKPTEFLEWEEYFYDKDSQKHLVVATASPYTPPVDPGSNAVLPSVVFDDAPLSDVIRGLAQQAGIKIIIDPYLDESGVMTNSSHVTVRFENVTAKQALAAIAENRGLKLERVENEPKPVYLIEKPQGQITVRKGKGIVKDHLSSITVDRVPLDEAIKDFGKRIGIRFAFDYDAIKTLKSKYPYYSGFENSVSVTWTNLTERQALEKLLSEQHLSMSTNSSGTVEVVFSSPTAAEVLKHFERFEPQFQEFFAACERPESNFNRDYKDLSKQEFPNFVGFRSMAQSLSLRASAELALGKSEEALRDIKACIRLADALKNEPIIVAGMIRVAIDGLIITPIWEGLAAHRWNDQQLQELQSALEKIELIPTTIRCLQANRAYENFLTSSISQRELLKKLSRSKLSEKADNSRDDSVFTDIVRMIGFRMIPWLPRGWIYANLALENRRFYRDFIEPIDAQRSVIPFGQLKANHEKTLEEFKKIRPGNFITSVSFPDFSKAIRVIARNQTEINEAIIACGLERYRLQHGKFPEKLESIASKFLQTIPHDIVNGKPLVYRLTDDGQYLLYSLAWDLKDNNAKPASWDWRSEQEGDWVWRFPTKRKSLN